MKSFTVLTSQVLRNAVHVEEAEVEKCVRDVMKEKKIEQKDTGYVWNPNISSSRQIILTSWRVLAVAQSDTIFRPFSANLQNEIRKQGMVMSSSVLENKLQSFN